LWDNIKLHLKVMVGHERRRAGLIWLKAGSISGLLHKIGNCQLVNKLSFRTTDLIIICLYFVCLFVELVSYLFSQSVSCLVGWLVV
jgi:hypothetical protein